MNYICAFCECAAASILAAGLERDRKKTSGIKLLCYLAVYMLIFVVHMNSSFPVEFSITSYAIYFVYVKWQYGEGMINTLTVVVMSLVFAGVIEFAVIWVLCQLFETDMMLNGYGVLATVITAAFSVVLYWSPIRKILGILERWDFIYAIVCLLSLMIFAPMTAIKAVVNLNMDDYIYIAVCVLVMWMLVLRVQKYRIEEKVRRQYFEAYKGVLQQIRRRQHKIKNQIDTAYGMYRIYGTYDELVEKQKEYLSQVLEYELPNDAVILEEPSVIALIYEKINGANDRGIRTETSFQCSMAGSRVSDVIWVEIIGTLFDNAIEAVENSPGNKKIWLEIKDSGSGKISIKIMNTYRPLLLQEIQSFFQSGYSTKGEGRGIGLYNVKKLVGKYHGDIVAHSLEYEKESVFMIEITI